MVNTKYNYPELKQEFYASEHVELSPFLRDKGILEQGRSIRDLSGTLQARFKGWGDEKKRWLEGLFYESRQKQGKKIQKEWDQVLDKVNESRRKVLSGMAKTLNDSTDAQFLAMIRDPDKILPVLRHFRLEAGESMDNSNNGINDRLIIALPENGFESKAPDEPETEPELDE